jgi:hypothetical protein
MLSNFACGKWGGERGVCVSGPLFIFGELQETLAKLAKCRLALPVGDPGNLALVGGDADRAYRNRLRARAAKEKQINRRVALNLEIKRLEAELTALTINLRSECAL